MSGREDNGINPGIRALEVPIRDSTTIRGSTFRRVRSLWQGVDPEKAVLNDREKPVNRRCYHEGYGGPVWLE